MKVLLVNDIHLSDRPPSSCTDSYTDDLFDLLRQTIKVAEDRRVSAVVWAGDVFHSKAPGRNSHRLVQLAIEVIQAHPCPVLIVPGNHDIQHDQLRSIHDTQPLGVLFRAGARQLWGRSPEFPALYGVPWQQAWTDEAVSEALRGWREDEYAGHSGQAGRAGLVIAHAPLYQPGFELPYEFYPAEKWAAAMAARGCCWYGHVHESHGVWECGSVTFANFGALSRGSLHEHNLSREISVGMWDSISGKFEQIPLSFRPASEVFRLREVQEVTDTKAKLGDFLASVGAAKLPVVSVEATIEYVQSLDIPPAVRDEVSELLTWAGQQE